MRISIRISAVCIAVMLAVGGVAAQSTTVRIGVPERDNLQYLTLWVALGAGYFQAEGIDPQIVVAERPNQAGQLLMQDRADVSLLQPPIFLGMIAQQRPIVLFANLLANDPVSLIVQRDVAAKLKLDPRAPLADRLKALKGLRIGTSNEQPRRLRVLMAEAGMDTERDIQMTIIPGDEHLTVFKEGVVDALYTHSPFLEEAIVNLGAVLIVNQAAGEVPALSNGQIHSLATTRAFADAHPDRVLAITRAIARAETLIHTDIVAARQAILKAGVTVPSPKHLETIVNLYRTAVPTTPRVSAALVENDATLYPARPSAPDFSKIHAADFVAPDFAERALSR